MAEGIDGEDAPEASVRKYAPAMAGETELIFSADALQELWSQLSGLNAEVVVLVSFRMALSDLILVRI